MSVPTIANAEGAGVTPTGGTPIATTGQLSPLVLNVANFLRDNKALKRRTGLLENKADIEFFRYKRFERALLSDEYKKKAANPRNQLIPVETKEDVSKVFILLILGRLIVPLEKLHYKDVKAVKGWKPNRQKPTVKPSQKASLDPDQYIGWLYNKPNPFLVLYGFLMLAAVFAVILFPLWPVFMRRGVWYLSMGVLGLLGLLFITAIIRLIIFIITWLVMPQAFWLFPNLFEDCGFFESFKPLYGWAEPAGKKKKGKKSKKGGAKADSAAPAAETVGSSNEKGAQASGAQASSGTAKKRPVVLEEVADE